MRLQVRSLEIPWCLSSQLVAVAHSKTFTVFLSAASPSLIFIFYFPCSVFKIAESQPTARV